MSRVERCYRQLIRLLPAEERAARGEEFLGLLLDLEADRAWPSAPEVLALLALAARLHARRLGMGRLSLGLLGAYLMVAGTRTASQIAAVAAEPGAGSPFVAFDPALAAFALLGLGVAVAWTLGAYRMALLLFGICAVLDIRALGAEYIPGTGFGFFLFVIGGVPGLIWIVTTCVGVPVVLGILASRAPVRTPPRIGFACLATAFVVQGAVFLGSGPALDSTLASLSRHCATWVLSAACAAAAAGYARRRGRPVVLAALVAGFASGWTLSLIMPQPTAAAVAVTVCAGEVARSLNARRANSVRAALHRT